MPNCTARSPPAEQCFFKRKTALPEQYFQICGPPAQTWEGSSYTTRIGLPSNHSYCRVTCRLSKWQSWKSVPDCWSSTR